MLNTLFLTFGILLGVVIDSFLSAFVPFSVVYLAIVFLYGKVDWKILLAFTVTISLILDVVGHHILGVNLLLFSIPLLAAYGLSLFFPDEDSIFGMIPVLISTWIYYTFVSVFPQLISFGEWGGLSLQDVFKSLVLSVITVIALWGLDIVWGQIRGDKLNSRLRLR